VGNAPRRCCHSPDEARQPRHGLREDSHQRDPDQDHLVHGRPGDPLDDKKDQADRGRDLAELDERDEQQVMVQLAALEAIRSGTTWRRVISWNSITAWPAWISTGTSSASAIYAVLLIQRLAYDEVPFVLWGQYVQPQVFAKRVQGVLRFAAPIIWNVWLEA
jgi:hypothetical protein